MRERLGLCLAIFLLGALPPGVEPLDDGEAWSPSIERMPEAVRAMLRPRMMRHGREASLIERAFATGSLAGVAYHAGEIALEPRLARPNAGSPSAVKAIPPVFFDLQDKLLDRAEALEHAAAQGNLERARFAYRAMTDTCAQCHGAFFDQPEVAP